MTPFLAFLAVNWFTFVVLAVGLIALAVALLRRLNPEHRSVLALLPGAALITAAVGSLLLPEWWALWVGVVGLVAFFLAVFALLLTGFWSRWIGWAVAVLIVIGLGGLCLPTIGQWLWEGGRNLTSLEVLEPGWLILLALVPPVFNHVARSIGMPDRKMPTLQLLSTILQSLILLTIAPLLVITPSSENWVALFLYVFAALLVAMSWKPVNAYLAAVQVGLPLLLIPVLILKAYGKVPQDLPHFFQGGVLAGIYIAVAVWLLVTPLLMRVLTPIEVWRPMVSGALRCALIVFLALALAEPRVRQSTQNMTVIFVVDMSASIPQEFDESKPGDKIDLRAARMRKFINESVQKRGAGHERDRAGLVIFGRRARLELPPSDAPHFNLVRLPDLPNPADREYTDIAAGLKLALASFPEDTGKRIVLISDGNENLGNAEEQGKLAEELGVQIDVVPVAAGQSNENEVLVERVEAPPLTEQGSQIPIRVLVRSFNKNYQVKARLLVRQITERELDATIDVPQTGNIGVEVGQLEQGKGVRVQKVSPGTVAAEAGIKDADEIYQIGDKWVHNPAGFRDLIQANAGKKVKILIRSDNVEPVGDVLVRLSYGLNSFSFKRPLTDQQRSYTYEAEIQPLGLEDDEGKLVLEGKLPGDRVQNNRASTHVVARGQRRILILEGKEGENQELAERLAAAGAAKFKVNVEPVSVLDRYKDRAKLAVYLSNFDCVILANVAREQVNEEQQDVIRSNTHDQGCGLVMIGGPDSFGAGGWQNTAVEKALPVDCDIKSLKVQGKGGLVLIMHACEMADGNSWERKIAKLAIERLGPADELGILDYDFSNKWVIPLQEIGDKRGWMLNQIDKMSPGDMPDFGGPVQMAHQALTNPNKDLATKHIIVISDGDPQAPSPSLLAKMKRDKVTMTTVGVATHGAPQDQNLGQMAIAPGKYYKVNDASKLPEIYIRETRLVSQSFVYEKKFNPIVQYRSGPTARLPEEVPELNGFVRTTPKASPLVEISIMTPKFKDEQDFPLLAYWHYGLGKSVAFTSAAGGPKFWSKPWYDSGIYGKFWEQLVDWSLRPTESRKLDMTTEYADGKVKIVVYARDDNGDPDTSLRLKGGITLPSSQPAEAGQKKELVFVQTNSGKYEATIPAEEAGSYFLSANAMRTVKVKGRDGVEHEVEEPVDSVRSGVTVPYSPEFADLQSNVGLLENLRARTGGLSYADNDKALAEAAASGNVYRAGVPKVRSLLPLWFWLLFVTAILLFFDVAARRLSLEMPEVVAGADRLWRRLRGLPIEEAEPEFMDRLQTRKAQAGAGMAASRAARRFEGEGGEDFPQVIDATGPTAPPPRPRPAAGPAPGPQTEAEAGDFASRLARAKKRALEERNKKDKP
jgi:uncharacterized membrane protein/Mg-chelatase subunit ChlD